jgi:hypothetical protein
MIGHALQTLWSRLVGLHHWADEVAALHNVEGGGTPAPGELARDPDRARAAQATPLAAAGRPAIPGTP